MTRSRSIVGLALGILVLWATGTATAQTPPSDLHQVGEHWTAWNPPTEFPEGAEVYIIEPGDTLWDLSTEFYGDPYLWPQLWERNQYIEDAHWIYPGDPLVTSVEVTPLEELGDVDLGDDPGAEEPAFRLDRERRAPEPLGTEDDIYCSGYIGPDDEQFAFRVIGSELEHQSQGLNGTAVSSIVGKTNLTVKNDLTVGDVIYLDGGRADGLSAGLVYTVVHPREFVQHPATEERFGRVYSYQGRVRVLSVQEGTAIAEIMSACGPIRVGDAMKPFVPEPVPLGRLDPMRPPNMPTTVQALEGAPVILKAKDGNLSIGQDHVVFIDVGIDDGATPGDVYTIYRLNRPGLPPVVLGELAILAVHERSSVAKVLRSRYTLYRGDVLELK